MRKLIGFLVWMFVFPCFAIEKLEGLDIISQVEQTVDFQKLKADQKGTVVIFLSPLCPCSEAHTATIKKLTSDYKDFKFVGVYSSDDTDEFPEYFKVKDFGFAVIKDNKYKYANELGALNTPHAFVIDPRGKVLYKGGVTSSSKAKTGSDPLLQHALDQVRAKKEVNPSETRVLGCAIRDT